MGTQGYLFDRWAELITVTLAENIARCNLGQTPIQKVRIQIVDDQVWPIGFKVIMENGLIAQNPHAANMESEQGALKIEYFYHNHSEIPQNTHSDDPVSNYFIPKARELDDAFYPDAWSFRMDDCIPSLLRSLAFRSICKLVPRQLKHQGIELAPNCAIQFYDGSNYLSFFYDNLSSELRRQIMFYLGDNRVFKLANEICFARPENQAWFRSLKTS